MRISDWSSDVCSSDLDGFLGRFEAAHRTRVGREYGGRNLSRTADQLLANIGLPNCVIATGGGLSAAYRRGFWLSGGRPSPARLETFDYILSGQATSHRTTTGLQS